MLFDHEITVSTLAKRITSLAELKSSSVVKVVFDYQSFALYFSRSPIPFVRDAVNLAEGLKMVEMFKHVGLYVYRRNALLRFTSLQPTDLEQTEKLEQLRMLENGIKIKVVETEYDSYSVDTQEDLEHAKAFYKKYLKRKEK